MRRQESKLSSINVGMDRATIVSCIGNPDDIKDSKTLPDGRVLRIDEYRLFKPGTSLFNAVVGPFFLTTTWWTPWLGEKFWSPYWIEYIDNKMTKFSRDVDWNPGIVADLTIHQK